MKRFFLALAFMLAACLADAAPVVRLLAPAATTRILPGASITLSAEASDAEEAIARVDFYAGGQLIGSVGAPPYTLDWNAVPAGRYNIVARAISASRARAATAPVRVVANTPPTVVLTANAATEPPLAPASLTLSAQVADAEDGIARVRFYRDGELVATVADAPYTATVDGLAPGPHRFTARVTDSFNDTVVSSPVVVKVGNPVSVAMRAPLARAHVVLPAAIPLAVEAASSTGTIAMVEFYADGALVASTSQAPFAASWIGAAPGSHKLHARATDSHGYAHSSHAVHVSVDVNVPPQVSLAAPASGARVDLGTSVMLRADAADTDGRVAQVEFLLGDQVLGAVAAAPYELSWRPQASGPYRLSARVTDDAGAVASSAAVEVSVIHPPAALFYIHTDHLGTPRVVTDESGAPVWNWDSDPFGVVPPNEDPRSTGSPFRCNLRFPGQYFDTETGLHYNYLRDYDPASGRYIQSDPTGLRGGLNTYLYANANPLQFVDPTGEIPLLIPVAMALAESGGSYVLPAAGMAIAAAIITPGDTSFDAQRRQERDDYHRRCDESNEPGLDRCEAARKSKARAEMCLEMRKDHARKWFNFTFDKGHWDQILQQMRRIQRAERQIRAHCKCS